MKKLFCLLLTLCLVLPLIACTKDGPQVTTTAPTTTNVSLKDAPLHIGVLYPGKVTEENTGSYAIHKELTMAMRRRGLDEELGITVKELVPELTNDVVKAVDELVEAGAVMIFGTALGYNEGLAEAADKYPEVIFCSLGGMNGNEANFVTYFAPLYYAYFMTGAAVAMKAQELECEDIGFVSTSGKDHPEAASLINAFTRGVQVYLPSATVHLKVLEPGATEAMEMDAVDDLFQNQGCKVFSSYTHTSGTLKRSYSLMLFATTPWFTTTDLDPEPKDDHDARLTAPQVRWFSFFMAALRAAEQCNTADEFSTALGTTNYYGNFGCDSFLEHKGTDNVWLDNFEGGCAPLTKLALSALDPEGLYEIKDVLDPSDQYPTGTVVYGPSEIFKGPFAGFLYTVTFYNEHGFSISHTEAAMVDTQGNIRLPAGEPPMEESEIREMDYYIMGIEVT